LPDDKRLTGRLLRTIKARNRQLKVDITVDALMGILFTALTTGVVYAIAWFLILVLAGGLVSAATGALWVTGIFLVVSLVSAWRQVDPFAGLKPMSDVDHLAFAVSHAVSGYVHFNRHSVAGLALVLMGGPINLVSAMGNWLHRLPTDPAVIDKAVEILSACRPEADLRKLRASPAAVVLLRRLTLIVQKAESTVVGLTEKGRELVARVGAEIGE
jgi:hypothetical protein